MQVVFHFAYIDPGTGSLIIQSLIGAIAGVAVFGRRILIGLKMKFSKNGPSAKQTDSSIASSSSTGDVSKSDATGK